MRSVLPLLLLASLGAAEPDPLTVACGDGATLVEHVLSSPVGRVWSDPALEPLRARAARMIGDAAKGLGTDPLALARVVKGLQFRVMGRDGRRIRWGAQADLGTTATLLRTWVAKSGSPARIEVGHADEAWRINDVVVARFGTMIAAGGDGADLPLEPGRAEADISLRCDPARLLAALSSGGAKRDEAAMSALAALAKHCGQVTFRADFGADGATWDARVAGAGAGWQPLDRAVVARLPTQVIAAVAIGVDGPALWKAWGDEILAAVDAAKHRDGPRGRDATLAELAAELKKAGIDDGPEALVAGMKGTLLFAETPGTPIPGMTLVVPRSPAIDRLAAAACAAAGVQPPADGQPAFLPLGKDLPFQVMLTSDAGHWLVTTDAGLAMTWTAGAPGGFADSALGKEMLAAAPSGACMAAATDTAAVIRMLSGPMNTMLGIASGWTQPERQAAMAGLFKLAQAIKPGIQWGMAGADGMHMVGRGDELTTVAVPAIIAAIAIPNLLESRITANEAAAAATIKSGIFPAEVQFQGGGYCDQDGDNVGEYGLLSELSGRRPVGQLAAGNLKLLQGPLATGDVANGYRYALYLPDGKGGAIGEPPQAGARQSIVDGVEVKDANAQEQHWVVYAWPADADSGRRMFAMHEDGQLRSKEWDGNEPVWNDLFGAGGWEAAPTWPVWSR